jgi:threonylcarbamoyladenosine tRNA methylthiotransferase MtaB
MSIKNQTTVLTFGCRLNTYESELIKQLLKENNIDDAIVVNTCAVTSEAERQARQSIRRLKKEYPDKRIIVTGCAVAVNKSAYIGIADKVVPNELKHQVENFRDNNSDLQKTTFLPVVSAGILSGFEGKSRAFLQIQTGCDNFCSFCIVRIARGKSISFPFDQILQQAQKFADQGYVEINLTGVDISSYKSNGKKLGDLVQLLLMKIPKQVRFRLSSLDPASIDKSLYDVMQEKRVLPYWHLSLQSGDRIILTNMSRRHKPEDIIDLTTQIRLIRPEIVIGADIIVGFPGETSEMFENTVSLIRQCEISLLHVFPYSARTGTVAATMQDQVATNIKQNRAKLIRDVGREILLNTMTRLLGQIVEVFVEKEILDATFGQNDCKYYLGKTEHFLNIIVYGNNVKIGQFVRAKVNKILEDHILSGNVDPTR